MKSYSNIQLSLIFHYFVSELDGDGDGRVSYRDFEFMMKYSLADGLWENIINAVSQVYFPSFFFVKQSLNKSWYRDLKLILVVSSPNWYDLISVFDS